VLSASKRIIRASHTRKSARPEYREQQQRTQPGDWKNNNSTIARNGAPGGRAASISLATPLNYQKMNDF